MKKWHFIIDVEKCEDCNNCFLACKDEHVDNEWPGYAAKQPNHGHKWINIMRKERGSYPIIDAAYRPTPCQHCEDAPCVKGSDGAVYKRPDGIVLIDPQKAQGREDIVKLCPYGAIYWNEALQIPQKCTMCAHLLDEGWKVPRCVQVCATGALKAMKLDDEELAEMIKKEKLEQLNPELKTGPSVYYKNLYRYNKCFIAGSIAVEKNGITDCAEGAGILIFKDGKKVGAGTTDNYGDFKIDRFAPGSGRYTVEITYREYPSKTVEVELGESVNIGTVIFK